jgi:hypothetical protein
VAVGGGHLYWGLAGYDVPTSSGVDVWSGAAVVQANLDGTDAKTNLGSGNGFSGVLAVGGGHLYWARANKIVEANLDGTGANTIVKHQGPAGIAVGS